MSFAKVSALKTYPFNFFTAENEKDRQGSLFISTKLYSPILEAYEAGSTMLLSGDRGTGKTSITYDFIRRKGDNQLICYVDDFSGLNLKYIETDLYKFILKGVVNSFFLEVKDLKLARSRLSEEERLLLTYFYINFATDATRGLAQRTARDLQMSSTKKFLQKFYNLFRHPLNIVSQFGVTLLADIVSRSAGTNTELNSTVVEYFPEIAAGVTSEFPAAESTLEALRKFTELVKKAGVKRLIIILDKIDEDQRLENAAEEIADFILPVLNNNKFLLDPSFQVVVSLWVVPLNFIRDKVRTQKIYSPEVVWDYQDLRQAYEKRVDVFSEGKGISFDKTFDDSVSEQMKGSLLDLSNRNPRDLWHLMNRIFREQYKLDPTATSISEQAVKNGMDEFVRKFNFYEYYPRKANARSNSMDIYSYAKHLLKLETTVFTRNMLNEKAGTGSSTQNYTVAMESLGVIEKTSSDKGEATYKIRDPKVSYALENGIDLTKT